MNILPGMTWLDASVWGEGVGEGEGEAGNEWGGWGIKPTSKCF